MVGLLTTSLEAQGNGAATPRGAGRQSFASHCAGCHGLDGRGGERAPDIATQEDMQRLSDAALSRLIEDGIAGTGMPAFRQLGKSRVVAIVGYLRTLQGTAANARLPGNPTAGKNLFFGSANCSSCHTMNGEGSGIASDLLAYAGHQSADQVREAIASAGAIGTRAHKLVAVKTAEGESLEGIVRNEDNFSVQLQTLDGAFHSLPKTYSQGSAQPPLVTDYVAKLSQRDLDDLVSYLLSMGTRLGNERQQARPGTETIHNREDRK